MHNENLDDIISAIAALQDHRATLGDAVVELAVASLQARLAALQPDVWAGPLQVADGSTGASANAVLQDTVAMLQARRAVLGNDLIDAALRPLLDHIAAVPAEPVRRLRQVSVLFLDIVGSTDLIRHLEPEDVQVVVDGALSAFARIVALHGGEVLRYAGDNLKAAFGANGRRDDDAERAVNCGLALLQEAARHGDAVRQAHGHEGFGARVGIHTGAVVRGGGIENDKSLSGLAVNVAARLEQAALPGTLRISIDTHRQVQGSFDVLEQPALQVKGLPEPMRSFQVLAPRDRRLRGLRHGADGVASRLLGRDHELACLRRVTAAVFAPGGTLNAATVIGETGLGKSRLLAEFEAGLPLDVRAGALWRASSHPQARHQPYGLLRDLLFWHHGVRDSHSQAQAQQTFAAALAPIFGAAADEQTALLGHLIGLDYSGSPFVGGILRDGAQLRSRGLHAWQQYLRLQSALQPLVLVLDDLQWADDASLDAIEQLARDSLALPLLLLCAARPELLQRRPQWCGDAPAHQRLDLQPLDDSARDALAHALQSRFAEPVPALQSLLAEQTAGNPYYMEALLQMLVDSGVVQTAGEHWQVQEAQLHSLKVPPTLVGVLQATLDALSADERRSMQQASIVGAQFWDEALATIDPRAPDELLALSLRELTLPQAQSAFEATREYHFRHHLLHQVTYDTVLRPDRREGHRHTALWLQARSPGRDNELAHQIAEHFERAGQNGQAIDYWLRAAESASRRQSDSIVLAHLERALALEDGTEPRRLWRLHHLHASATMRRGDAPGHLRDLEILQRLTDDIDDDALRLRLGNQQVWSLYLHTRYEEAIELGERLLEQVGDTSALEAARVHANVIAACMRLPRFELGLVHGQRGLERARAAGDKLIEAVIHNNIGTVYMLDERLAPARAHLGAAQQAYQAAGNRQGVAMVCNNLATILHYAGLQVEARDQFLSVIEECRLVGGYPAMEAIGHAHLSNVLFELGESQAGYDAALEGLRIAQPIGDRMAQAIAHRGAQLCARAMGRMPEALAQARAASAAFSDARRQDLVWTEWAAAVRIRYEMGEAAQALSEAEALLGEVAAQGGWGDCLDGPMYLHHVLAPLGDSRANDLLAAAHKLLHTLAGRFADVVPPEAFLRNVSGRREITEAWEAGRGG